MSARKIQTGPQIHSASTVANIAALANRSGEVSPNLQLAIFRYVALSEERATVDREINRISAEEPVEVSQRELKAWKARSGFAALDARDTKLYNDLKDLEDSICEMPCLTVGDVAAKVGFVNTYLRSEPGSDYARQHAEVLASMAFLTTGSNAPTLANDAAKDTMIEVEQGARDVPSRISPDIQYAVQTLTFFEAREKALSQARAEFEVHNNPKLGFRDSGPEWQKWVKDTPYKRLCEQEDRVQEVITALENFLRATDCNTLDDIALKVQFNRFWIDDLYEDAGDLAEYSASLVRSIAAMVAKSAT